MSDWAPRSEASCGRREDGGAARTEALLAAAGALGRAGAAGRRAEEPGRAPRPLPQREGAVPPGAVGPGRAAAAATARAVPLRQVCKGHG